MSNVTRRTGSHVYQYVRAWHQRFDKRALAAANFAEKAKVNRRRLLTRRKFLKLGLCSSGIDASGLCFIQSRLDVIAGSGFRLTTNLRINQIAVTTSITMTVT